MDAGFDLITMGRVSVDLYPEQIGVRARRRARRSRSRSAAARRTSPSPRRGSARRAAVITKVGDDPFGPYVRARAARASASTTASSAPHPTLRTPLVFCEIHPPDDFPLLFYREPTAPDMTLAVDELDLDAIRAARVFWTTGTGPQRRAVARRDARRAGGARDARAAAITVHDLDHRPMFWADEREAGALGARGAARTPPSPSATATRSRSPSARATRTRPPTRCSSSACEVAIVKQGPAGVLARTRRRRRRGPAGRALDVVYGLGAGDAFGGALVHGLLQGWELERTLRLANAAGAYRRLASSPAPTRCRRMRPRRCSRRRSCA